MAMPSGPSSTFDYYETLEISKTATQDEITKSYRKLALIHHPDKNPENPGATERFQKISAAYEILRDPALRQRYDASNSNFGSSSPSSSSGFPFFDFGYPDLNELLLREFLRATGRSSFGFGSSDDFPNMSHYPGFSRADFECSQAREKAMKEFREERQREQEKRELEREIKKKAEIKRKEDEIKAMEELQQQDYTKQEQLWIHLNAETQIQKQATCLHTKFWPKEPQKKKFKCGTCHQKRGPMAFKCPHCALLECQNCRQKA